MSFYHDVIANNKTLKAQITAALRKENQSCYDLEANLNRSHQSVSGTLRAMVLDGTIEVAPETSVNQFNNTVRTYKIKD